MNTRQEFEKWIASPPFEQWQEIRTRWATPNGRYPRPPSRGKEQTVDRVYETLVESNDDLTLTQLSKLTGISDFCIFYAVRTLMTRNQVLRVSEAWASIGAKYRANPKFN